MTTPEGTNPAQPQPADPATPATPVVAENPSPPPPAPPSEPDIDELELQEAKAAAEAEEAVRSAPPVTEPVSGEPAAPPPVAAPSNDQQQPAAAPGSTPAQPPADTPLIPKGRFDEVNARASKAEADLAKARETAAFWQGQAEALRQHPTAAAPAPGQPPQAPQPPAQTPEQRIADLRQQKAAIAIQFDEGELRLAEFEKQKDALDDQIQAIREEALLSKVKVPATQSAPQGDNALYLDRLTAQLETDHPWVAVFEQVDSQADWDYLKAQAKANLIARNVDMTQGAISSYYLREEMAKLADKIGPALLTERATAKGIALPGTEKPPASAPAAPAAPQPPQQQQQQRPPLSPTAIARQTKLAAAAGAPPSLAAMAGDTGVDPGQVDDERLNVMSDDEIGNLPQATRRKLLGIV